MLTIGEFIRMISSDSFDKAREKGWIEEQDIEMQDSPLDKKTAARIIHMYLKNIHYVTEVKDITPAYELRDLFDCKVCVNHIAQVYLRKIIPAAPIQDFKIFDSLSTVSREEAENYLKKMEKYIQIDKLGRR